MMKAFKVVFYSEELLHKLLILKFKLVFFSPDESFRPAEAVETAGDDYIGELNQGFAGWRETRPPRPKAEKLPVK